LIDKTEDRIAELEEELGYSQAKGDISGAGAAKAILSGSMLRIIANAAGVGKLGSDALNAYTELNERRNDLESYKDQLKEYQERLREINDEIAATRDELRSCQAKK